MNNSSTNNISFPSDVWDNEAFNEEGMGVLADVSLQHIYAQMARHEISAIWEAGSGNGAAHLGLAKMVMKLWR